ncbi:MAG: DUF4332 domain-containing protein, partial [Planctomycetota bacterium]|nr:DUF4332 domain-containing protein [Planctomycetota bacterium]
MQLTDVQIERFGSLRNVSIEKLSQRVTVFWGPNGSGKTTFVRFLRGLMYGFRQNTSWSQSEPGAESGYARIKTESGPRNLRRSWSGNSSEQFAMTDEYDQPAISGQGNSLPVWITEDVFRELFTVGHDEAQRFELLTRLCIESGADKSQNDTELRQSEAALIQTACDRDGIGMQAGVVHRISELRRRQGALQSEISALRRPSGDLPSRIEQLIREIDAATVGLERADTRICDIDTEIRRLEQLLIEVRSRNVLPLDRQAIEGEIRTVSTKLERWREIRRLIGRECESSRMSAVQYAGPMESGRTIRTIVSRLEERIQMLTERLPGTTPSESERNHDADVIFQLRGEIACLCSYIGQSEQASVRHVESQQCQIASRIQADTSEMERLLESTIATLKAELSRAENVLADSAIPRTDVVCSFAGHKESFDPGIQGNSGFRTIAEVEAQIEPLRTERAHLATERCGTEETRGSKRILLEQLRQEMAGIATLEQLDALRAQVAQLDSEIVLLEEHRRQLDRTEASLREVIERLKSRSHSKVLDLASQYVQRLTEDECRSVSVRLPERILVQTAHSEQPLTLEQLSRGTRDQVGLALRLALIQVRSETHGQVPLILDDVFVTSDDARASAAVKLLTELTQQGLQVIFFTCQKDVCDLFDRFNAQVRTFDNRMELPKLAPILLPPVIPQPILHAYVEPVMEVRPIVTQKPVEAETQPNSTNWLFYLEVDHGVEDLAGITLGELEALRSTGILSIDDLLNRTVPQLQEATRLKGFQLSVDRLHALRGQAELTTRVPMLRRSDAALLYASGIHSAEELSRLRPETVFDRVSEFQRSESGSRYRRGGRLIDRQQAINWARFGQFTRSLDDARHNRSRFSDRSTPRTTPNVTHSVVAAGSARITPEASGDQAPGSHTISRRRRRITGDFDVQERRARRLARRKRQTARLRTEPNEVEGESSEVADQSGGLRFF